MMKPENKRKQLSMKQQNAEIGGKKARSKQHTTQPTIDSVELWLVQEQCV
jgi:hypothetical protein